MLHRAPEIKLDEKDREISGRRLIQYFFACFSKARD